MQATKLHYTQEMKYLRAVADYLIEQGYEVEEPKTKHRDLLDVWGVFKGKKCFQEIYCTIYPQRDGIHGVWYQGDNESVEMFMNADGVLQHMDCFSCILDGLKPMPKKSRKKKNARKK